MFPGAGLTLAGCLCLSLYSIQVCLGSITLVRVLRLVHQLHMVVNILMELGIHAPWFADIFRYKRLLVNGSFQYYRVEFLSSG